MNETQTIDLLVHPIRWIGDTRYRVRMLERPTPPHTWRLVCRDPRGGVQVLACVSFVGESNRRRTMRARLKDVRR